MSSITVFSPATVANVSCGYDAMGFALASLGDEMVFTKTDELGVKIANIEGADLPYDPKKNVVGVVANLMLEKSGADFGLEISIKKNFMPGSGLGSSAASAAGTAFGVNHFLSKPYTKLALTEFAMQGEVAACGSAIADNVAAALHGGFILVRSYEPLDIISIPTPDELMATVIHPQIEIRTEDARKVVPKEISVKTAVAQWANVGGLISGLYESNYKTIASSLVDYVAEPGRKPLIPHFNSVKKASMDAGALGVGISGSGPSIFALSKGIDTAQKAADAMQEVYKTTGISFNVYVSPISHKGVRLQ